MERVKRILIPVAAHEEDGVELARHALLGARAALAEDAHVDLLAAVPAISEASSGAAAAMREVLRARNEHVHGRMTALSEEIEKIGLKCDIHLKEGDVHPGQIISDTAEELGCEWIVMPTHARHGLKRMLLGSVASRVVQSATVPVLLVR
jgi:nucleotide-binding universal stress UspA family protein